MATKEQEIKVLDRFRRIIADLEKDGMESYVGATFKGIFEVAETNIENDWLICPVAEWETLKEEYVSSIDKVVEEHEMRLDKTIERSTEEHNLLNSRYEDAMKEIIQLKATMVYKDSQGYKEEQEELFQQSLSEKDTLIIQLKAKLYDLMTNN